MTDLHVPIATPDHFYINGEWVAPSSDSRFDVVDPATEEPYFRVAEAQAADMDRAITAARAAFDQGPWPRMSHAERAEYLTAIGDAMMDRLMDFAAVWPRQSGVVAQLGAFMLSTVPATFHDYAALAGTFPFEEPVKPIPGPVPGGEFGLRVHEPVGVVGAIVPWNGPLPLIAIKIAPALLAGCTTIVKASPEAPGEALIMGEIAEAVGLPPGVLNVVTADREVSEILVRDPRVDKIAFTGSTAAGRRIGSLMGERIGRCTLELGGKSPAIILDDADIGAAANLLAAAECLVSGQVCLSLTRIIVPRNRHDEMVDALSAFFSEVNVGNPFDDGVGMGPLAMARQRDRVEHYIHKGIDEGATLATGGKRPKHLDRGWFIEPTVFGNVDNRQTIAQEEIFGPVLSVIPADSEDDAIRIANDSIFGLNASVFTPDNDRARSVAARLRTGTVGHNALRADLGIGFGGFKQSGIGREGGTEGLRAYLETKAIILDGPPARYR